MILCPACGSGQHAHCIDQGCECECVLEGFVENEDYDDFDPDEDWVDCPSCGGTGITIESFDCPYCDGTGEIEK